MKNIVKHYTHVNDWNAMCGMKDYEFDTLNWWKSIELQTKLLVEEATESQEAANTGDVVEVLDGAVDVFVILSRLLHMLEKAGFDVDGAIQQVLDNNDEKVFNSYYEACAAKDALDERDDADYWVDTAVHNGMPYYVVKRLDGKIMKHVKFKPVKLDKFVPKSRS